MNTTTRLKKLEVRLESLVEDKNDQYRTRVILYTPGEDVDKLAREMWSSGFKGKIVAVPKFKGSSEIREATGP